MALTIFWHLGYHIELLDINPAFAEKLVDVIDHAFYTIYWVVLIEENYMILTLSSL